MDTRKNTCTRLSSVQEEHALGQDLENYPFDAQEFRRSLREVNTELKLNFLRPIYFEKIVCPSPT